MTDTRSAPWAMALAGFFIVACGSRRADDARLETGVDFVAVAPETVMELLVSSNQKKLYAYRFAPGERFAVTTGRPGTPPEHCVAGTGFDRLLRALARVSVKGEHHPTANEAGRQWAAVRLRDQSVLEPIDLDLALPRHGADPVLFKFRGRPYVADMDAEALVAAEKGCAALGSGSP